MGQKGAGDIIFLRDQVREFALAQLACLKPLEVAPHPGITLGHRLVPVRSVGCYVPGGYYPLIASVHMQVVTARAAGVERVIVCAPPRGEGVSPPTLVAMDACGADEIYCLGGVQALAAMAFGTSEIAPVEMITGPGNPFVAEAKRQLFGEVGIDLLAGPTEILITLATREIAEQAWRRRGAIAVVDGAEAMVAYADWFAPEHLEVITNDPGWYLERLRNYGSIFLGEEATVAYSDKAIGTNHTLPTGRAARYTGGLWVGKFIKVVTYQRLSRQGSNFIAPYASRIAAMEGMLAHAATCDRRLKKYGGR